MGESKQNRKNPLTTVAISQESAAKLDAYLANSTMSRKEFIEQMIDYVIRTGYDVRSSVCDLSPIESIAKRMEDATKVVEQNNSAFGKLTELLTSLNQSAEEEDMMAALPSPAEFMQMQDEMRMTEDERDQLREDNDALLRETEQLQRWKELASAELKRVKDGQRFFGTIHVRTEFNVEPLD